VCESRLFYKKCFGITSNSFEIYVFPEPVSPNHTFAIPYQGDFVSCSCVFNRRLLHSARYYNMRFCFNMPFLFRPQIHVQKTSTKQQQTNNYAMTIISTNKTPKLTTNSQQINDQKAVNNLNSSSSKTKTSSRNTIYSKKHVFYVFLYVLLTCVLHSFLNNSVP